MATEEQRLHNILRRPTLTRGKGGLNVPGLRRACAARELGVDGGRAQLVARLLCALLPETNTTSLAPCGARPFAERLKASVLRRLRGQGAAPSERVTAAEVRAFFDRTPGISTTRHTLPDLLDEAVGLFRLLGLTSFETLRVLRVQAAPGPRETPPVNLLMLGESHSANRGDGDQLMRYVMGQVALERKCVDLYLESGFDWGAQRGGGALTTIRTTYPVVPLLRVHHVDVRSVVPQAVAIDDVQGIRDSGANWYGSSAYQFRFRFYARTALGRYLEELCLFELNAREHFALLTGCTGVLEEGDRAPAQVEAAHDADLAVFKAIYPARYPEHAPPPDWDECNPANYGLVPPVLPPDFPGFHSASVFAALRRRFATQRRRFLRTTRMDAGRLDRAVERWARGMVGDFRNSTDAAMDLFALYRMFGTFADRDKSGRRRHRDTRCPPEQRNIVFIAGDWHVRSGLGPLIALVFGARATVVIERGRAGVGVSAADHVASAPPLAVF